ncbi:MAG: hypothetical protein E6Q36_01330 [Chryseobacterium sp.]|nr:MAG: hypothetical protein E6Q36_01330 [Chryseobacterium sp.]
MILFARICGEKTGLLSRKILNVESIPVGTEIKFGEFSGIVTSCYFALNDAQFVSSFEIYAPNEHEFEQIKEALLRNLFLH